MTAGRELVNRVPATLGLECLCLRHHQLEHRAGWSVTGHPAAMLVWTSPTGHVYYSPPDGSD